MKEVLAFDSCNFIHFHESTKQDNYMIQDPSIAFLIEIKTMLPNFVLFMSEFFN